MTGSPGRAPARVLLLFADVSAGKVLSYWSGWPRHFQQSPLFECVPLNVGRADAWARLRNLLTAAAGAYEGVVVLHSAFSNQRFVSSRLAAAIRATGKPTAIFLANEYKLMVEKLAFCDELGVKLLVSQSHSPDVHRLYQQRLGCRVMFLPNGGLDPALFKPDTAWAERPIDVGFRAYETPWYLGHDDKRDLAERATAAAPALGLRADISTDPRDRFDEPGWAGFLNRCKAVLGAEAGTDYFELNDESRHRVLQYTERHPEATRDEVFARFFQNYQSRVSGRMIASRHIEAAGTRTLQLLIEGEYGGLIKPDVHYVPIRRDLSNLVGALERIRDAAYCRAIVDNAYALAIHELTYQRLIEKFHAEWCHGISE